MIAEQKIKAYKALQKLVEFYDDELKDNLSIPDATEIGRWVRGLEIMKRFGIPIEYKYGGVSYPVKNAYDDWTRIGLFKEGDISCSDDGSQPNNEWLYKIHFTCGAHIFGQSYPSKTFSAFWAELLSYSPKYCDTQNNAMYFTEDNAKKVYEDFWDIFNKYEVLVAEELKEKRKEKLLAELALLEEGK